MARRPPTVLAGAILTYVGAVVLLIAGVSLLLGAGGRSVGSG